MQTENDIINLLEKHFLSKGGIILTKCTTSQRGVDLEIQLDNDKIIIEAKGETSSKNGSKRFGKPFNKNQITNHIARAILTILKLKSIDKKYLNAKFIIAFPDTKEHRKQLTMINTNLKKLEIDTYLVNNKKIAVL